MNSFKIKCWSVWVLGLIFSFTAQSQEIGPANGSLVIVGGGRLDQEIIKRFLDLAGGTDDETHTSLAKIDRYKIYLTPIIPAGFPKTFFIGQLSFCMDCSIPHFRFPDKAFVQTPARRINGSRSERRCG